MIDIVDNYLPEKQFFELFNAMKDFSFYWHLSNIIAKPTSPNLLSKPNGNTSWSDNIGNMQLCHLFYRMHEHNAYTFHLVTPILEKIDPVAVIRIKANLSLSTKEVEIGGLHIDVEDEDTPDCVRTSILYMNTNDGYTLFEDGTKVESVMNRLVTFPHTTKHAGTTCTNAPFRMVINFNYITSTKL